VGQFRIFRYSRSVFKDFERSWRYVYTCGKKRPCGLSQVHLYESGKGDEYEADVIWEILKTMKTKNVFVRMSCLDYMMKRFIDRKKCHLIAGIYTGIQRNKILERECVERSFRRIKSAKIIEHHVFFWYKVRKRCEKFKWELFERTWHPDRVMSWCMDTDWIASVAWRCDQS